MALVPCRECGKEVSEDAKVCQSCGIKNPSTKAQADQIILRQNIMRWAKIGIAILIIGAIAARIYVSLAVTPSVSNDGTKESTPKLQSTIPVKQQIIQKDYKEKVGEMLDSDKSVREISNETGLSKKEIRKIKHDKKVKEKEMEDKKNGK